MYDEESGSGAVVSRGYCNGGGATVGSEIMDQCEHEKRGWDG